jgi:VWFA-related protein
MSGLLVLAGATWLPAQETAPTFPAQVEQVIVDVVVTDKEGTPIRGLTASDFLVKEDGTPQSIESFQAIELPEEPVPMATAAPRVSTNTGPEATPGRSFVVIFDNVHLTPFRTQAAQAAVTSFLENGVREGDYVTLISTAGGRWWTTRMNTGRERLLEIVEHLEGRYVPDTSLERMTDWEAMRIHVYNDPLVATKVYRRYVIYGSVNPELYGGPDDPFISAKATEVYSEATRRNRATLDVLERALDGLSGARGRKSVILVSEGFIFDPGLDEFKRIEQASRRANAAVYFLNARGLEAMPTAYSAQFGQALGDRELGLFRESFDATAGSDSIAANTGGFTVRNTNDLSKGIRRIADESRVYYLLGYVPTNRSMDGKFREIGVELREGKDREVRARKGYYAPSPDQAAAPAAQPDVDPVIQTALDSPWVEQEIPLRMTAYVGDEEKPGTLKVHVVTEVDIRDLAFEESQGREHASIEFLLVVAHGETGEYFRQDQTVEMKLRPSTRRRFDRDGFPIDRDFDLQPGDHQAKIVVREIATGKVGSVTHEFEVPPVEGFRVSTPILSDTRSPDDSGQGVRPTRLAHRQFRQGGEVLCAFEVFGATKGADGMPRVAQGFEVKRDDGTVFTTARPSVIKPTPDGELARIVGFSLARATPGRYEMLLTFRDEHSGEVLGLREPFEVVPAQEAGGDGAPAGGR